MYFINSTINKYNSDLVNLYPYEIVSDIDNNLKSNNNYIFYKNTNKEFNSSILEVDYYPNFNYYYYLFGYFDFNDFFDELYNEDIDYSKIKNSNFSNIMSNIDTKFNHHNSNISFLDNSYYIKKNNNTNLQLYYDNLLYNIPQKHFENKNTKYPYSNFFEYLPTQSKKYNINSNYSNYSRSFDDFNTNSYYNNTIYLFNKKNNNTLNTELYVNNDINRYGKVNDLDNMYFNYSYNN